MPSKCVSREQAAAELEARVRAYVDGWMTWRPDREQWIERKLNAEAYQHGYLHLFQQYAGTMTGRMLLDLGCGLGGFAAAAALQGARAVALDPNPEHLAITQLRLMRQGLPLLPMYQAVGEALPFPDGTFDLVGVLQVLEHVADPTQVLKEIHRVLRSGGVALVTYLRRRALIEPHYRLPLLAWIPLRLAERMIQVTGRYVERQPTRSLEIVRMHYFRRGEFGQRTREAGFAKCVFPEAVQLDLVRHPAKRVVIQALRKMGLCRWLSMAFQLRTSSQLCILFKPC